MTSSDAVVTHNSSDEDEEQDEITLQVLDGTLSKWTNYIHGWQGRYFVLQDATLAYYKSEHDSAFGCRGALTIGKSIIQPHAFDDCRFDITVNDNVWYLRADTTEQRQKWIDAIETYKADSGFGSQGDLRRYGSMISLTSNKSLASTSSFKNSRALKEKVAEMETFRDILTRQIESLQYYFELSASSNEAAASSDSDDFLETPTPDHQNYIFDVSSESGSNQGIHKPTTALDFKGEALTFKATSAGILATLQHCIDIIQQRDETWKKRIEKETERRRKAEDTLRKVAAHEHNESNRRPVVVYGGPDFEEGPHSALNDDEWHDAMDAALEQQDIEDKRISRLLSKNDHALLTPSTSIEPINKSILKTQSLAKQIETLTLKQVQYALAGVSDGVWEIFADEGEMKMYRREVEEDGVVLDPLKAVHQVVGCTAHEYCHYFYEVEYKMDWDTTLVTVDTIEKPTEDSVIIHQVHKKQWPTTQRDSLFWSHIRKVPELTGPDVHDLWIVCNHDVDHDKVPLNSRMIRLGLTVSMVCQTIIEPPPEGQPFTRDNLTCRIYYVSQINPRGWAPTSILRSIYKREYPKFLKRFTSYVMAKVEDKDITF